MTTIERRQNVFLFTLCINIVALCLKYTRYICLYTHYYCKPPLDEDEIDTLKMGQEHLRLIQRGLDRFKAEGREKRFSFDRQAIKELEALEEIYTLVIQDHNKIKEILDRGLVVLEAIELHKEVPIDDVLNTVGFFETLARRLGQGIE